MKRTIIQKSKYHFQLDSPKKFGLFNRDSPKKREMENLRSDINRMKRNVDSLVEMQIIAQMLITKKEERLEELQKQRTTCSPRKEKPWIQRQNFYIFFGVEITFFLEFNHILKKNFSQNQNKENDKCAWHFLFKQKFQINKLNLWDEQKMQ